MHYNSRKHNITLHNKVKDILTFSKCFVQFWELAVILVFKSRYWQISLTFLCSVHCSIGIQRTSVDPDLYIPTLFDNMPELGAMYTPVHDQSIYFLLWYAHVCWVV